MDHATPILTPHDDYLDWCLARPGTSHFIELAGSKTHYLEWVGPTDAPVLLLVHGFMGHAHWWDFMAPALATDYRVVSMDLSGMGDSGHLSEYSVDSYVEEIAGVIRHISSKPLTLIGHSFGARCTILATYAYPELISHAIAVDSRVSFPNTESPRGFNPNTGRSKRAYPDIASAKARFRLVPEEPGTHPLIYDHMAEHALTKASEGWVWKFDEKIADIGRTPKVSDATALPLLKVPFDYICGEHSRVSPLEHAQQVAAAIAVGRGPIVIPGAYHHVPLGQPLALVSVLRALLATSRR